jgi:hypothetical protein
MNSNSYSNYLYYSFQNKNERILLDYNNLYYKIIDKNPVSNYIRNEKILKPNKKVRWGHINNVGETYSKIDYDRTIDSQQITRNLHEYRMMKKAERENTLLNPNNSMINLFDFR